MSTANLSEILPVAEALPRADKVRLIQAMVVSLAREENVSLLNPNLQYEVWSPYDAQEGAARLYEFLKSEGSGRSET